MASRSSELIGALTAPATESQGTHRRRRRRRRLLPLPYAATLLAALVAGRSRFDVEAGGEAAAAAEAANEAHKAPSGLDGSAVAAAAIAATAATATAVMAAAAAEAAEAVARRVLHEVGPAATAEGRWHL